MVILTPRAVGCLALFFLGCAHEQSPNAHATPQPRATERDSGALDANEVAVADAQALSDTRVAEHLAATPDAEEPAFDVSSAERRVFRQISAGALTHPPVRVTWEMLRDHHRVRLLLRCELGKRGASRGMGLKIDGHEEDASLWDVPTEARFDGAIVDERTAFSVSLRTDPAAIEPCTKAVSPLAVSCIPARVKVLHAGAALIVELDKPHQQDLVPWHWQPGAVERVGGLECTLTPGDLDAGAASKTGRFVGTVYFYRPLVFVAPRAHSPGIEWVFQNDDMVVQQGAYRWMPPEP